MDFVTVRELRTRTAEVQARLASGDVVLTSNGRPTALLTRVEEGELEELVREVRLARARMQLRRMQAAARESGADALQMADIDAEVTAGRRERRARDQ